MSLSERVPVLMTFQQRELLERLARRQGTSVGAVIRDAVDAYAAPRRRARHEALEELYALEAPVDDWDVMEAEIVVARSGGDTASGA